MTRQRPADHLPAEVLAREDFIQACTRRDLGAVLRLARQWGGAGFSASHLARRCEMTVSRVQDYIHGRVAAQRLEVFTRVADGLHIPGAMFELGPRPWEKHPPTAEPAPYHGVHDEEGTSVLRRDFMRLGVSAAAAGVMSGVPARTSGPRVGTSTLDAVRINLGRLRSLDDHLGGADTLPLYLTELEKLSALMNSGSFAPDTGRELRTLYAEQAQQVGWAAFDAGDAQRATDMFERSFDAAQAADSTDLAANALALRSYQLLAAGTIAPELTDMSLSAAPASAHPAVRSLLYQRGAWTYAVAGRVEDTARALGQAHEALAEAVAEPSPDWASWAHNPVELEIMTGRCWSELRRPLRAIPALESAMSTYADSHSRDKALYLSWLADSYLDAGEVEAAAVATGRAFDLSDNVASVRPQARLRKLRARLAPFAGLVTEVSDLLMRRPLNPVEVRG